MNDLLKYSRLCTGSLLLCTVPGFALPPASAPAISQEYASPSPFIQRLFTEDHVLSYDAILELLEQIENDELDALCTPGDWNQIGQFLAYLSRQGLLPNDSEIDRAVLERDIQEMLCPDPELAVSSWFLGETEFSIAPAIYNGRMDAMLCGGWFGKKWKHVKHFVKHHKTAVIVGSIIVVAAVAIVVTVAIAVSSAAAAGAAAAAAGAGSADPKTQKQDAKTTTVEEQVSALQTIASETDLVPTLKNENAQIEADQARLIGSALAHVAMETSSPASHPDAWDKMIQSGHGTIDTAFSTDQSIHYIDKPAFENPGDWHINLYQQQGEQALRQANYEQAVEHFDKAIDANPQNPDAYLQRAYAHMGLDEFDQSLNDYRMYITCESPQPKPSILSNPIDFGIGFAQNVPKGAVESGRQLTAFASDLIIHPVDTSCNVCSAFAALAELACTQQWSALSESIAPEVCQLADEWNGLTAREQGERSGYIFGKYGADILIPGATAKVLSKGIEGAKDLIVVAKNLQTAEQTFALEALAASASRAGVLEDFPVLFKNGERIEGGVKDIVVQSRHEQTLRELGLWDSFQKYQKAEAFLEQFRGQYLPESQVRELIHQTGIPTFPRPQGIPENYRVKLSKDGAGMKFVHPNEEVTYIRIMPGKPHSPNILQREPYVVQVVHGKSLDNFGNIVTGNAPEAHVPINKFIYRE